MKTWTAVLLTFTYLTSASATVEFGSLLSRIEEKINASVIETSPTEVKPMKVVVPIDLAFQRDSALWNSITAAYDHLKSYDLQARHRFLYVASKVNAKPNSERVQELKKWISDEAHLILSLGMPAYFYTEWKQKTADINEAINALEAPYPSIEIKPKVVRVVADDKVFLNEIRDEIKSMSSSEGNPIQYALFAGALLVTFLMGFTLRKSKDQYLKKLETEKGTATPLPTHNEIETIPVVTAAPVVMSSSNTFFFDQGVNLEEECKKIIKKNSHLLQMAKLNVVPVARSPFKTTVDAPAESVAESLNWLLKGTLAIANSGIGKATHMEWHCSEQHGRLSLEFVLHGLECDLKALYLNTLIEGNGSAPAHFGRSEMALAEHLASVGFKSGNKKTTVSLGLDILSSTLSH